MSLHNSFTVGHGTGTHTEREREEEGKKREINDWKYVYTILSMEHGKQFEWCEAKIQTEPIQMEWTEKTRIILMAIGTVNDVMDV